MIQAATSTRDTVPALPRTLTSLQAARAAAAILVVLFHTSVSIIAQPKYWDSQPFGRIFDFGDSGVLFFFVLSGFIITNAHHQDLGRPERLRAYAWKRFRRIYPIYWIVLVLVMPVYFEVPTFGKGYETQPGVIFSSVLLLHVTSSREVILVSWTLFHEVLFYLFFALAIWRVRVGMVAIGVWFLLSAITMTTHAQSVWTGFYVSNLNTLFGFGMAAAVWVRRRQVPSPLAVALLGIAIFLLAGIDQTYWLQLSTAIRTLVFGLGATLIVAALVELERQSRVEIPGWLQRLGDASYSIYLVHFFELSLFAKLIWASGGDRILPAPVAFVLLAGLSLLVGTLCYVGVERPLLRILGGGRKGVSLPGKPSYPQ
jgi:peptidoglycan/LPS O-acetylase OafA/YrhL